MVETKDVYNPDVVAALILSGQQPIDLQVHPHTQRTFARFKDSMLFRKAYGGYREMRVQVGRFVRVRNAFYGVACGRTPLDLEDFLGRVE